MTQGLVNNVRVSILSKKTQLIIMFDMQLEGIENASSPRVHGNNQILHLDEPVVNVKASRDESEL